MYTLLKLTDSDTRIPKMTRISFCFDWLTKTHTHAHQRKPFATLLRATKQFALPNPSWSGTDGMNHYCHLPPTRNEETWLPEMNFDWGLWVTMEEKIVNLLICFEEFCFALATSSRWYCLDDSDVKADCSCSQGELITACQAFETLFYVYFSVKYYFPVAARSHSGFRCEQVSSHDQFLPVECSHVNNSGPYSSHLVILLTQWFLGHGTLIVHLKIISKTFKSLLTCCVLKSYHCFQCADRIIKTLKASPQC